MEGSKRLVVAALCAALVCVAPGRAAPTEADRLDDIARQLERLQKSLAPVQRTQDDVADLKTQQAELRREVARLRAAREGTDTLATQLEELTRSLKEVRASVRDLQTSMRQDLDRLRDEHVTTTLVAQKARAEIDDLKRQDTRLRDELDRLRSERPTTQPRVALYEPADSTLQRDLADLRAEVDRLRRDLAVPRTPVLGVPQVSFYEGPATRATGEVADLRREIDRLNRELAECRSTPPDRASYYTAVPVPATGRVELANTYPQGMRIVVNGREYDLAPNETRVITGVPAGTFTYQVLGVQPTAQARQLAANSTFTIQTYVP
jgi:prefoldin subunit 5